MATKRQAEAGAGRGSGRARRGGAAARLDEELRKLRVEDVLLQSVVSLINLTLARIAKPDEQDLEQAQIGIEAMRALGRPAAREPAAQVREALSQLQVAYAREAGGGAARAARRGRRPRAGATSRPRNRVAIGLPGYGPRPARPRTIEPNR